ncbi:TonB-dependent receptor [Halocella sp. SP3-1]|uniref:TonB-dependent receptor n=1 Tax=Halocella sp. SP3-1 TaxID=2382161 RepID=UPI00197AB8D4|nr:TonB-dependent receptor [Halocella sp. SP3-1]
MLRNYNRVLGLLMICFILMAVSVPINAEESSEDEVEYELETVKVTAEKQQEENVQEVPMSITAFDEFDLQDKKIESVEEIANYVPNLMIFNNGSWGMNSPTMRGLSAPAESFTVSTGMFIDGVPVLMATGFDDGLIDVERVEVLRGPQGTLYGKNTETGVINIITRQPDNQFRGKVSVEGAKLLSGEAGDLLTDNFTLNVSGPLQEDKLFFNIAAQYDQEDGFIENIVTGDTVDDRESWFGKANLRWTPTEELDISFSTSRLKRDDGAVRMTLGEAGAAAYGLPGQEDRYVSSNVEGYTKSTSNAQSFQVEYDFGNSLKLTSVTARRVYNEDTFDDWDFSQMTLMHSYKDNEYKKIFQELRLDSSSEKLKWLLGLYFDKDNNNFDYVTESDYPTMASTINREFTGESYSVFGQVNYNLTPKANLIGGLRYEKQKQEYKNNIFNTKTDDSWNEISPKIAYEYNLTPSLMTYASVSKGYRSGGFNAFATDSEYISYDEEKLWSYEIGAKRTFFKNRIILNGNLYYMDISDMQVTEAVSQNESYLTNAAEATSKGVEFDMTARVSRNLTLMVGYGYNDIKFDNFKDALGNYKGNRNPYAPEHTFNIGAQYRNFNGFYARTDLIGYGEMYFDKANEYSRDAYEIVNAKIGYETENYDIYLYGKNIFDKEYNSYGYYSGYYTIYSDPGEIGLGLTYRF